MSLTRNNISRRPIKSSSHTHYLYVYCSLNRTRDTRYKFITYSIRTGFSIYCTRQSGDFIINNIVLSLLYILYKFSLFSSATYIFVSTTVNSVKYTADVLLLPNQPINIYLKRNAKKKKNILFVSYCRIQYCLNLF